MDGKQKVLGSELWIRLNGIIQIKKEVDGTVPDFFLPNWEVHKKSCRFMRLTAR